MKYQLAKLYRGDRFFGYGIAVGGLLLDGQASTVVETSPNEIPRVITTFNLSNEHSEEQPRIDLDKPRVSNEIMFSIHPDRPLTSSQSEEIKEVLNDFLSRHNL